MVSFKLASFLLLAAGYAQALTSTLQQLTANIGSNPNNVPIFYYKPTTVAAKPALIVAMHYCTGTAQAYFQGTSLAQLADQYGFIVIYPSSPRSGGCWDVNTNATLTHNGGSDSLGIVNAARYAIANWNVDSTRVFATGTSSGAMMTNVMMGAYPDVFAAGSLYSGVPYACFAGASDWNSQCAQGQLILTPQQWGDRVRSGYPGYSGKRPPVQFWHGSVDTTLFPQNFQEEIKQWTNVFGVSQTPTSNLTNNPQSGYWRASFGPNVQGIWAVNVGHTVPEHETDTLTWFGIIGGKIGGNDPTATTTGGTTTVGPTTTPTTSAPSTTTSSPTTGGASQWGQCGGIGWTGATTCQSPFKCTVINAYYSQCL